MSIAEATNDSDLAVDPRQLDDEPLLDHAMSIAGFHRDLVRPQAGGWLSRDGVPVDLMVPESLSGPGGRRRARIPPHDSEAARRTPGLEAAVVDNAPQVIEALDPADTRSATIAVAGPAALLVSKLHRLGERAGDPGRLVDKDAHDIYRLLVSVDTAQLAERIRELRDDDLAGRSTDTAVNYLRQLFVDGPRTGAIMAGRAEALAGDPETAAASSAALADDLLRALGVD